MKREDIERNDFPVGRRGYEQAAVDAHLRRVADELEGRRAPSAPLSAGTSEQVRAILQAAEASAAELRADTGREIAALASRLGELERELGALLEALRRSGERLSEGLAKLDQAPDEDFAGAEPAQVDDVPPLDGDEAGARLIALNMALSGTPREETAAYLAEHFQLADAEALLDDVYERAGQ